ncbi:MAG: hypothetical protein AAFV19_13505 [Pseudomonadota bacterium]
MTGPGPGWGPRPLPQPGTFGQRPAPGQQTCKFCDAALTPHQVVTGGVCGAQRCEMRKVQEASRAVFQRDWKNFLERQRTAVEASAPEIGRAAARLARDPAAIAIGTVPRQERPLVALPDHRREDFAAHLDQIIAKAFDEGEPDLDLTDREREERAEELLIDATCATCQGKCCILGGPAHAFLTAVNIQQFRARHPGATPEAIKAHYLAKLPEASVEHSCVYHGPMGCVLDRRERGDVCNRYHCNPQTQLLKSFRDMKAEAAIIIATEDNAGPALATFETEGGWVPFAADADMAAFDGDLDPDPDLIQRAVTAAMEQIPPNLPAAGSSVGPEARTCTWCGKVIDAHKAASTGSCGAPACEGRRIADASEAVTRQKHERYLGLKDRVEAAFATELDDAARALATDRQALLTGVVPHQNNPVAPLSAERRAAFEAHLDAVIEEGFALDPDEYDDRKNRAVIDRPEMPIADAACATCQGSCCMAGFAGQGFIDKWMVAQYRRTDPDPTPDGFRALYLGSLPDASVEQSCPYHTDRGCALPRQMRATICNTFLCKGVKELIRRAKEAPPDNAAIVAQHEGVPKALGVFRAETGWQPVIRDGTDRAANSDGA